MRFIFIVLFLVSFNSVIIGNEKKVYYCEKNGNIVLDIDGKILDFFKGSKTDSHRFNFMVNNNEIVTGHNFGFIGKVFLPLLKVDGRDDFFLGRLIILF